MTTGWIEHSPYSTVFDETARARIGALKPGFIEKGSILFRPGDAPGGFVLILSGRVGVFLTGRSGREILLYSVEPGETCVQTTIGLLGQRQYSGEAVAETDVTAVMVPASQFAALMDESEAFRRFVFTAFGDRLADVTRMLEQVAFVTVPKRLARVLVERAGSEGKVEATHGELAVLIGSSREVVSRRLERFQEEGFVRLERGIVMIADRAGLDALAEDE